MTTGAPPPAPPMVGRRHALGEQFARVAALAALLLLPSAARATDSVHTLRAGFAAITERHLERTDPTDLGHWALRGLEALEPNISTSRRGPALRIAFPGRLPIERLMGGTPSSVAEAVATLYAEAEILSPSIQRAGPQRVLQAGFEEIFNHLDPYSRYVTPGEARQARERRLGAADLGLTLGPAPGNGVAVLTVAPNSAAAQVGLRPGDRVLAADGVPLSAGALADAARLLEGPPGSGLLLQIRRGRRTQELLLTRAAAPPLAVSSEVRDGVLWLRVPVFSAGTASQLDSALDRAESATRGVVLDLRGNRGGLLQQAIQVADSFLSLGTVAFTEGRHPDARRRFVATGGDLADGRPLVVLVDGRTASAAEVVAAAIGDHGRGVVVGSTTLGKGLIQILVPMPEGAELLVSWSRILAPLGWPLQSLGVMPTVCTSRGAEETSAALAALATGDNLLSPMLARHRAARAPVPVSEVTALRSACPPAEGRDADLAAARTLLDRPETYRAALHRPDG
ncbi:S41 family peptidase [Muricoccus radiodurans]|uniref:S41 family peptidase n=1 Tax=Muricoccus radiodurans TaxID=2231721 RepID=UPI003CEE401A